ncbi:uncharacterized protein ATNIH1004_011718 [Aspergillus tanneri]|uniref:Uncharacterized protein n=1 Tax=Aspergillus tanneri TaxID=1220188 RepID=A0A5M9M3H0_9EURO|nr:uncharacterized protein ATNIH1004_011718 [Aspergillus tanneri]KAA8641582.1 hypothetical protein ATNIH1004_011718 [Aspergillus tanneri]
MSNTITPSTTTITVETTGTFSMQVYKDDEGAKIVVLIDKEKSDVYVNCTEDGSTLTERDNWAT